MPVILLVHALINSWKIPMANSHETYLATRVLAFAFVSFVLSVQVKLPTHSHSPLTTESTNVLKSPWDVA